MLPQKSGRQFVKTGVDTAGSGSCPGVGGAEPYMFMGSLACYSGQLLMLAGRVPSVICGP
jgi:hypothetical protein